MTDLENILPLWHELEAAGSDYALATVVDVDGPSYRRPGARMLIAADGRRAGTVSGGCLEAEVAKRAFWLTESGPLVRRYSTAEDDGDMPYGSGCGGVVYVLLERRATAAPLLTARIGLSRARAVGNCNDTRWRRHSEEDVRRANHTIRRNRREPQIECGDTSQPRRVGARTDAVNRPRADDQWA